MVDMSKISDYEIGMTVYGKITGIKPYGAFVTFDDHVTGLIHISELSDKFVRDIERFVKVNDYVMAKVIDIDYEHEQLRLSFKALNENRRKRNKRIPFLGMPENRIGFQSIKDMMPQWLKENNDDQN